MFARELSNEMTFDLDIFFVLSRSSSLAKAIGRSSRSHEEMFLLSAVSGGEIKESKSELETANESQSGRCDLE